MDSLVHWLIGATAETPRWFVTVTTVISAASAVAALTPTPRDDNIIGRLYRMLDVLALNVGRAKDRPPSGSTGEAQTNPR